ncbi:type IV secretion protein Rhs, partial [Roseateles aquatilis]
HVYADHLNAPRLLVDKNNALRWRWISEPFGSTAPETAPAGLAPITFNLRFPGQFFDSESGLNYNYFRDYDATTGRYVQSDPIGLGGGVNTYGYVLGNPLGYTDAEGLQVIIVVPGRNGGRFDPDFPPGVGPNSESNLGSTTTTRAVEEERKKTYQTYTRYNPKTGKCYSGRTSGYDDPSTNINNRAMSQPLLNAEGFQPPVLDRSSENYSAIRGREQRLIETNGGAQSTGGTSRNMINGISTWNPRRPFYLNDALIEFGEAIPSGNCVCQ